MTTSRDLRLDVLAAWRAVEDDDLDTARRVFATCADPGTAFLLSLRLMSMLTVQWRGKGAVHPQIDRLVAEEIREDVDRL